MPSCEETPLQLSSQESFFRVSFVMPRHPGDSADIDRSVSLPSPPLPAVWSDTCQLPGALLLEHLLHPWAPCCAARAQQELQAAGTLLVLMRN